MNGSSATPLPSISSTEPGWLNAKNPQEPEQLAPGQILASRFKVIRFLAHGGMGDVYAAEDLRGGGSVALKTIRRGAELTNDLLERFRREVSSAKKVTHQNVCRIYDLHHHMPMPRTLTHNGLEPAYELVFYTMELLMGETLSDLIRKHGKLSRQQALAIVTQIVAGLQAIHDAGIIHRDLKSSNIMVTFGSSPDSVHVKITDFGLARTLEPQDTSGSYRTATGALLGTPEYMAPEVLYQLGPTNKTSDIYSLGVVVYQMLTGKLPSPAAQVGTPSTPAPPSSLVRIPQRWDTAIIRCLERDPARRFRTASEFLDALTGRRTSRKIALALIVLAMLSAICLGILYRARRVLPKREFIAVFGFKDLSGASEPGNLSAAFTTGLRAELRVSEDVDVVPGEDVARLKLDLKIPDQESYSRQTLERIRENTGASVVLLGSYLASAPPNQQITLYLIAQRTDSGETVASVKEEGPPTALVQLITRATDDLRSQIHLTARSPEAERLARSSLPQNPEALRLYADGLQIMHTYDLMGARDLFEKAIAIERDYAPAHAELAEALSDLGYEPEARREITEALMLSNGLPREQRLLIEGEYYDITHDYPKAVERFRTLFDFYPENVYYGLLLVSVQDAPDQMKTIAELRKLPPPLNADPRIDVWEALAESNLSQFEHERVAATRGATKARERGARGQLAEALIQQGLAERMLGHPGDAKALFLESKQISDSLHDQISSARCLRLLAVLSLDSGDLGDAWKLDSAVLEIGRRMGSLVSQAWILDSMGDIRLEQGQLDDASQLYSQSLELWRDEQSTTRIPMEQLGIGRVYYRQGKCSEAKRRFDDVLRAFTDLQNKRMQAETLAELSNVLLETGDVRGARRAAEQMLAVQNSFENALTQGDLLLTAARLARERGSFSEARQRCTEALKQFTADGQKGNVARANLQLALLSLDEGQASPAKTLATQSVAEFEREGRIPDAAMARAAGALSYLADGKTAAARAFLEPAVEQMANMQDVLARNFVETVRARIIAAAGNVSGARTMLQSIIESCSSNGLIRDRLEAMLALAELEHRADSKLIGEASRCGFERIARRTRQISPN